MAIGLSWPARNQIVCALRFFYGVTLGHDAMRAQQATVDRAKALLESLGSPA